MLLQVFFFQDNVVYFRRPFSWARVFAYVYLVFGLVFLAGAIVAELSTDPALIAGVSMTSQLLALGGLVFVIVLQFIAPKADRLSAHLAFGAVKWWALFALLLIALYGAMTALNYVFGLGQVVDATAVIAQICRARPAKRRRASRRCRWRRFC